MNKNKKMMLKGSQKVGRWLYRSTSKHLFCSLKSSEHIILQIEYKAFKSGIFSAFKPTTMEIKQKTESLPRSEFVVLRRTGICNFVSGH